MKSCFMGLRCSFIGQYLLHIEGNATEMEVDVPSNCLVIIKDYQSDSTH